MWAGSLTFAFIPAFGVGASLHAPWPEIGSYLILVAALGFLVRRSVFLRGYRKSASAVLGVRVSWRGSEDVPRARAHYEQWCARRGLHPRSARATGTSR
ncbi:MAG TPA: hypothetical protein VFW65_37480 [Pseudonocardiaceae bacterium]|nr:hypothetical protein [Pseudonocardiaceae bacterium]